MLVGGRGHAARIGTRGAGRGGAGKPLKVRTQGLDGFSIGSGSVDLRRVEQLVDPEQVRALAQLMRVIIERGLADGTRSAQDVAASLLERVARRGWKEIAPRTGVACGLALPRVQELCACIDRWRRDAGRI